MSTDASITFSEDNMSIIAVTASSNISLQLAPELKTHSDVANMKLPGDYKG